MHQLVMPLALPGLQIHRHDALAEQPIARPVPAVEIPRRQLHRQISQSQLFIDADLPPHARVAGVVRGILFPSVVTKLARLRNRVKDPQPLARPHIEPAHETLYVALALRNVPSLARRAHDHRIARHHRSSMQPDLIVHQIDFLVVIELQIDGAVRAESSNNRPVLALRAINRYPGVT